MREIEFLPPWYSQFLRRRRMVFFQTWMTIGVALGLGLWMFLAERNQKNAESVLDTLAGQIQQTSTQLAQMERGVSRELRFFSVRVPRGFHPRDTFDFRPQIGLRPFFG